MWLDEGKQVKIKWLKWTIDFCNSNLEGINGKAKFLLIFTLDTLFYPCRDPQQINEDLSSLESPVLPDEIWDQVLNVQGTLKLFLNDIIAMREKKRNKIWKLPVKFIPSFALFDDGSCKSAYTPSEINDKFLQARFLSYRNYGVPINFPVDIENFPLEIKDGKLPSLDEPYYLGWFFGILDGIPIKWIGKCKGCERFFLNPSERKKVYCNSSCASRSIVRTKREDLKKDPKKYEAYLKKQKMYMRKRYQNMRKAQLGPNVRVGKKPRKRTV
jgi:hypothetical protein